MRLHILGDLHLEFGTANVPETDADVVVLAGDIHLGREGRKWARTHLQDKPVVFVGANPARDSILSSSLQSMECWFFSIHAHA